MKLTQNILVCTDFSKSSELALDAAAILAAQNEAKVTLVHVVDSHVFNTRPTTYTDPGTQSVISESETEAKIYEALNNLIEERFAKAPSAEPIVVEDDDAAHGIVELAKKQGVDMVVLSTHGRTGLAHALIGSVAEKVVRTAPCPVLTLRSKAED